MVTNLQETLSIENKVLKLFYVFQLKADDI